MNFASRRLPHVPSVQVMLFNDSMAILFACATSVARQAIEGAGGKCITLSPTTDQPLEAAA